MDDCWTDAITKVEEMKQDIYLDEENLKPFPTCLKLSNKLGIWLTKQIALEQCSDLHNPIQSDNNA